MAFCSNCGNTVDPNAKFCEFCGNPVANINNNYVEEEPKQENNNYVNYNQAQSGEYNAQANDNYTGYNNQQFNPADQMIFNRPKARFTFAEAIQNVFRHYVDFKGRAVKSEYWYYFLFNTIVSAIFGILSKGSDVFDTISLIYSLAVFLPGLAVSVRRLHDVGKSGTYLLIELIPLVGWIMVLYQLAQNSAPDNEYGLAAEVPVPDNNSFYQQ